MTIQEAIDQADEIMPNQYTDEQKLRWLSDLDGKIARELFARYLTPLPGLLPFEGHENAEEELLVLEPYASDIYVNFLLSRVSQANAEIQKYNLFATLFNTAFAQYAAWVNRTRMPNDAGRWRM